jgi:hypothetical protein
MRLWSLHPEYLDPQGLVALWREGLLARAVLSGGTKGYQHHPQLDRFREQTDPLLAIDAYLRQVYKEASRRGYRFDEGKIGRTTRCRKITVTRGQIDFERRHLLKKLKTRNRMRHDALAAVTIVKTHPVFRVVEGDREKWEMDSGPATFA